MCTYLIIGGGSLVELPDGLALKSSGRSLPTAIKSGSDDFVTGLFDVFGSTSDGDCDDVWWF